MNESCYQSTFAMMQIRFQMEVIGNLPQSEKESLTDDQIFEMLPDCLKCVATHYVQSPGRVSRGDEQDESIARPSNVAQVITWESRAETKGECSAYRSHETESVQNINRIVLSYLVDRR